MEENRGLCTQNTLDCSCFQMNCLRKDPPRKDCGDHPDSTEHKETNELLCRSKNLQEKAPRSQGIILNIALSPCSSPHLALTSGATQGKCCESFCKRNKITLRSGVRTSLRSKLMDCTCAMNCSHISLLSLSQYPEEENSLHTRIWAFPCTDGP